MKTIRHTPNAYDDVLAGQLHTEIATSLKTDDIAVHVEEDAAVCFEEPVTDSSGKIKLEKGKPVTKLVWRRIDTREEVSPPAKLVPDDAGPGAHIQLGPPTVVVAVPDRVDQEQVRSLIAAHKPKVIEKVDVADDRVAALEQRIAVLEAQLKGKK